MLAQDYLTLRLVRLKPVEEPISQNEGLSFVFPKAGVVEYVGESATKRLAPGDAFVLDGTGKGKLRAADKGEVVFWCFSLRVEHLFPLFANEEICLLQNVADGFKGTRLYPASSAVARECHRLLGEIPPQFNLDHRSQLLRVAAAILTIEFNTAQTQRVGFIRAEQHMMQVFEKLSTSELLGSSVEELARKFGCSRRHLSRLFHQYFGVSVAALRMEMRLLKAVSLLRDPDAKIIRVAEECGFNHLGLFNTCFKRRFGASPGQWRKATLKTGASSGGPGAPGTDCPLRVNGLCPWSARANDCGGTTGQSPQATALAPPVPNLKGLTGLIGCQSVLGTQCNTGDGRGRNSARINS